MKPLELHPLCALFPRLAQTDFDVLRADIAAHGLRQPIVLFDGMILDGGNRYRACIEAGLEPATVPFGDGDPLAFVLSENLHRRHLTPGQQAAIVASAQDWAKAQLQGANRHTIKRCNVAPLETVADRAAKSGGSIRTQKMADKVAKADPELAKKVAHGEITLPQAATMAAQKDRPEVHHPRPARRSKNGKKADAMRRELAQLSAYGVSMLCTYARLLRTAIHAQADFSDEERDMLAQLGRDISNIPVRRVSA